MFPSHDQAAKVYDKRKRYVNETSGPPGEKFLNSILTADSYKKLLPQNWLSTLNQMIPYMPYKPVTEKEKEAKRLKEMDERELYLYNKARGMSPDQPLSGKGMLEFILQNPKIYGSPQSYSNGGIATLKIDDELRKAQEEMKKLMKQYKNKDLDWDAVKRSYKIWTK